MVEKYDFYLGAWTYLFSCTMRFNYEDLGVPVRCVDHAHISGGGGGGVELPIYDIVRMCGANSPLFQRFQVYDKPPYSKKSI